MMKKIIYLLLALLLSVSLFAACGEPETPPTPPVEYTVTFKQDGQEDVVKKVTSGSALTDIPTPVAKEGYTIVWETVDLSNVTKNVTVKAVATANEYTITMENGEETETLKVTYDSSYTISYVPTKSGYEFIGWQNKQDSEDTISTTGVWTRTSDVTVVPVWSVISYDVTFKQAGQADVVKTVEFGTPLTDIPTPVAKTGYDIAWDVTDFSNITDDLTVNAVETAKTYTLTVEDGTTPSPAITVTFDAGYTITQTPTKAGYDFGGWKNKADNQPVAVTGTWAIDGNVTVVPIWNIQSYTVTFKQAGQEDVVKTVEYGATLADVPTPVAKTGYDIVWDRNDFTNITADIEVNAVETAKTYTLTVEDGTTPSPTITVTFDASYTIAQTPNNPGYTLMGWKNKANEEQLVSATGTWAIDADVTVIPNWVANEDVRIISFEGIKKENLSVFVQALAKDTATGVDVEVPVNYEFNIASELAGCSVNGKIVSALLDANGKALLGTLTISENVTFKVHLVTETEGFFTLTFIEAGQVPVDVQVAENTAILPASIPTVQNTAVQTEGNVMAWDFNRYALVSASANVYTVEKAPTVYITYKLDVSKGYILASDLTALGIEDNGNGVYVQQASVGNVTLLSYVRSDDYKIEKFVIEGTETVFTATDANALTVDEQVTITIVLTASTDSDKANDNFQWSENV